MIRKQYKTHERCNWIGETREGKLWWHYKIQDKWVSFSTNPPNWPEKNGWVEVSPEEFVGERQFVEGTELWHTTKVVVFNGVVPSAYKKDGTPDSTNHLPSLQEFIRNAETGFWQELLPSQFINTKDIDMALKISDFCVKVPNAFVSEAIQKTAFENGYQWGGSGKQVVNTDKPFLCFDVKRKAIEWGDDKYLGKPCTFEECMEKLSVKPLMIGMYEVQANKQEGVTVGCKSLSREKVLELKKLINKEDFECNDGTPIYIDYFREQIIVEGIVIAFDMANQIIELVE